MLRKYIKRISAVLLTGTLLLINVGCNKGNSSDIKSDTNEKVQINVGYIPSTEDILYYVAQEEGYFEEEGLNTELYSFDNSGQGINAIISKKVDVGAFGSSAINSFIVKGGDLTSFGGEGSEGSSIISKAENLERFKQVENFKGAKIATVRLSTADIVLRGYLKENGIDLNNDVEINELETPATVIEAIKNGTADVGVVWSPYRTLAENQGLKIVKQTGDIYDNHVCCRQVALTSTLKNNKNTYVKFMRSLIKAYKFIQDNHDKSIDDTLEYVTIDRDVVNNEVYGGEIGNSPDPDKEKIVEFWKLMNSADFISSDIDINKYIDTDIYEEALKSIIEENPDDPVYTELENNFSK